MMAFVRFVLVGGSFSLGYALITAGLIRFAAAPPLPTSVVVYLLCIPAAFWAQRRIAFRADQQAKGAIWIYTATQIGSLAVVSAITTRFVTRVFWQDTLLFLLTAGTAAVASFLICRYIIFRTQAPDGR
ncbi:MULTISPECIES: GtrA family protein [unclassified Yoonia]|uniref:GtrA family protein n=1 Tax=unclassified Yoonia TaxID=2629118 RepID=UPI002AFF23E8|nr:MULTISPECIES: GtrA family protein [unclassified Yoonia]